MLCRATVILKFSIMCCNIVKSGHYLKDTENEYTMTTVLLLVTCG